MRNLQIGIIGSAGPEEYAFEKPARKMMVAAEALGRGLARNGCVVVTGGKGGVMLAASRGAKSAGGLTVAESSGIARYTSNAYVDVEVITGDLAFRGPSQLVAMCDGIIALGGGAGTLQELAVAYRLRVPTVLLMGYGGWTDRVGALEWLDERKLLQFEQSGSAEDAVLMVLSLVQSRKGK